MIGDSFEIVSCDERGYMIKCVINNKTIFLVFTKKGYCRGGDIHPINQYNTVLNGRIMFKLNLISGEVVHHIKVNQTLEVPKDTAHLMVALEDSIVIEWHDGELPPFKEKIIYEPYRQLIKKKYLDVE